MQIANIFSEIPNDLTTEIFEPLYKQLFCANVHIERIISYGQASAEDQWYDQIQAEWVLLLQGQARLELADPHQTIALHVGDYVFIPPHQRHRVSWTDPSQPTIWLAIHLYECHHE
ncbi:MAG: hypothetical protein RL637_899 [Pseudomonadota bacterium]|jgi:cupin 2 domain-containing protein